MKLISRDDFPNLLNSMGLTGEGAEIGVHIGQFSWWILREWKGKKLYSIDPYLHQGRKLDTSDCSQEEHDANYKLCKSILKEFGSRSEIIREKSKTAWMKIPNKLDFVYIDACHDYRSVYADLEIWYNMVKVGGIIAGHDYKNSFVRKNLVEVKRCVDNFFQATGEKVLTTDAEFGDNIQSWYVIRKKSYPSVIS